MVEFDILLWIHLFRVPYQSSPPVPHTREILWGEYHMLGRGASIHSRYDKFTGVALGRFILGLLEASIAPGFVLFTSQWCTQQEQGKRTGIWFSFNGFANFIG